MDQQFGEVRLGFGLLLLLDGSAFETVACEASRGRREIFDVGYALDGEKAV